MERYLFTVICCLFTLSAFSVEEVLEEELVLSTPDQVATLLSEPSYLVGGLISPLSGHPVLRQTDLVVKGAQNIILKRTYIPPYIPASFPQHKNNQGEWEKKYLYDHLSKNYKGWQFFPHLRLEFTFFDMKVRLTDPSGITFDFHLSGPNYSVTEFISPAYALSNASGDLPSGQHDPRNIHITYEDNGKKLVVHTPYGAHRVYEQKKVMTIQGRHALRNDSRMPTIYLLQKEILPNGKILKYHYDKNLSLACIESLDLKERFVYASLHLSGSPRAGSCHFTSSTGITAHYNFQKRPLHIEIKEKVKGGSHKEEYSGSWPPLLTSVSSPLYRHEQLDYCDRFLLTTYFGKNDVFTSFHVGFGQDPHYKVHKLSFPVAQNDAFYPVHELSYQPPIAGKSEGMTIVKNSDWTFTIYHFSKNLLTTLIQYFGHDGLLKKEKVFTWDEKNWLKSIEMRDGKRALLYKRSYEFDRFGNPILDIFTGNLTGEGSQESYAIKREFSQDGRNLLRREESEDGKVLCIDYLPDTNLGISKLTKEGNRILLREFSTYDDSYNLIQKIVDDGISEDKNDVLKVTQRTIINYHLRQQAPFLHMPEWIEEKYLEEGFEKLIKLTHLVYDSQGNVAQEEIYDANGQLAYTIYKEYNERGDLISETNSLGQKASYVYDLRGLLSNTSNFSARLRKSLHYDTKGRLREQTEIGNDGIKHTSLFVYDAHDRLIQKIDPFNQVTHYSHDPLVSQVIKTDYPLWHGSRHCRPRCNRL